MMSLEIYCEGGVSKNQCATLTLTASQLSSLPCTTCDVSNAQKLPPKWPLTAEAASKSPDLITLFCQ